MLIDCRRGCMAASILFAYLAVGAYGESGEPALALAYDAQTRRPVPIPPSERGLRTVVAEPWFKVSHQGIVLEGQRSSAMAICSSAMYRAGVCCTSRRINASPLFSH